jgi:hypothetical protein
VRTLVEGRPEEDVRRALAATRRERPDDALAFFRACLGRRVSPELGALRHAVPAIRRAEDDYGF